MEEPDEDTRADMIMMVSVIWDFLQCFIVVFFSGERRG